MKKSILLAVLFCTMTGVYAQATIDTVEISAIKYETDYLGRDYKNWLEYTNKLFTQAEVFIKNPSENANLVIFINKFYSYDSLKYNIIDSNKVRLEQLKSVAIRTKNNVALAKITKVLFSVDQLKVFMKTSDAKVWKRLEDIEIAYLQEEVYKRLNDY